jgi:hypothetical protein
MAQKTARVRQRPRLGYEAGSFVAPAFKAANDGGALRADDESIDSFFEVPAAVLCATCGQADCPGCGNASEHESGIVAIVPWERPGAVWTRLWATANAATQGAEAFFAVMPDGEIPPAMRFAVLAELLAVASMAAILLPLAALVFPSRVLEMIQSPDSRASALRWILLGIPALALWMTLGHVTHGAALDAGAQREGARPQRRRAVRFGLYACGWDLMAGPLGAFIMLVTRGLHDALEIAEHAVRVPGRAATAFLTGIYQLPADGACHARRYGMVGVTLVLTATGLGTALLVALAAR